MDRGHTHVNMYLAFLIGVLLGLALTYYFRKNSKQSVPRERFRIEFWVYCEREDRPPDSDILSRISAAPFAPGGIRNEDARMIGDIRFNIGRAVRSRNALLFRPDLFSDGDSEIDVQALKKIDDVDTMVTVRYVAEKMIPEPKRSLRLATYAVEAICDISRGVAIWDAVKQELISPEALRERLRENQDGAAFEHHVDIRWAETEAGVSFTRGMEKIGLPNLTFEDQPLDQRTLALYLVSETARKCWDAELLLDAKFDGFGESFSVEIGAEPTASPRHTGPVVNLRAFRYRAVE